MMISGPGRRPRGGEGATNFRFGTTASRPACQCAAAGRGWRGFNRMRMILKRPRSRRARRRGGGLGAGGLSPGAAEVTLGAGGLSCCQARARDSEVREATGTRGEGKTQRNSVRRKEDH
eukprot:120255-Hanusia_phi.AAC.2